MSEVFAWAVFASFILALLVINYLLTRWLVDPAESYTLATFAVVSCLTISLLCVLLLPVDVFTASKGDIRTEWTQVVVSQQLVQSTYLALFGALLVLCYVVVPFAFFYGEERGADFDEDQEPCGKSAGALRHTVFFMVFVVLLLLTGLSFRAGQKARLQHGKEIQFFHHVLDVDHAGDAAISFSIASLTFLGVMAWIFYSAYGLASFPFELIRSRRSFHEQRVEIENDMATLRERHRAIQAKYGSRGDGGGASLDMSKMTTRDRWNLTKLQREQRLLTHYNYRLQEMEEAAQSWIAKTMIILTPFRVLIGTALVGLSLLVFISLLLTSIDRFLHSGCALSCGFLLESQRALWNPLDWLLTWLSNYFPLDFVALAVLTLYIFCCSLYGITALGIRVAFIPIFPIKPRRSLPQALLLMCFVLAHILLVLCMTLLTIAHQYATFGSQTIRRDDGSLEGCSTRSDPKHCHISVIAAFFNRIIIGSSVFSVGYFFANWLFCGVFVLVFLHAWLLRQPRSPLLDGRLDEMDDEALGLLDMGTEHKT